jgi:hypothetical protein
MDGSVKQSWSTLRLGCLAALFAIATTAIAGCGTGADPTAADADTPVAAPGARQAAVPAPATAAPATAAPAGAATPGGTVVPLYTVPSHPSWAAVIAAKKAQPTVPVVAVVNPANGPGAGPDLGYTVGIAALVAAGVKVIGYVSTRQSQRAAAEVEAEIDRWRAWYPSLGGIFFDEQSQDPGHEGHYRTLSDYAKAKGLAFTVGNPGNDPSPTYVGTVDVMLIYEDAGLPGMARLDGWHAQYDKRNFGIIPYSVPAVDESFIQEARKRVGFIYLQSDVSPNPWDSVPGYFESLLAALAR